MRYLLNIGLAVPNEPELLRPAAVLDAIETAGLRFLSLAVHTSDSEPTAVVAVEAPAWFVDEMIEHLARILRQEAIAFAALALDGSIARGRLVGPKAATWGPFNPAFFLLPDGRRADVAA